ncbi:hypothetical protein MJO28_009598 [Puccinia striiformis f. sp. tritici]|uniref:Uncharacterized protein n=1 Tax=Puccinia striiformis f. sp. tritici TaxID=168172 RepID=A0ACC0E9P3_9BASI|nr:hypothetical protein MJO28_009598 [Puccinia striiformis f. sp. tritici]
MNSLLFDSAAARFSRPDFLKFCGKFTIFTKTIPLLKTCFGADSPITTSIGSTYKICGDVEGSNAYFMLIVTWQTHLPRDKVVRPRPDVGTILSWEQFVINPFEGEDLIQVIVFHQNQLTSGVQVALKGGIVIRLLLGWKYCQVNSDIKALIGSRITYIRLFQGSDSNNGSAIAQAYKATINFNLAALDCDPLEYRIDLSNNFC